MNSKITTQALIKFLPFEEELKTDLLTNWERLDFDKKFLIEGAIWDAYFVIYEERIEQNKLLAFQLAEEKKEKLDEGFYKRVVEKTEKDLENDVINGVSTADLSAARSAMEKIIQELKATKRI